MRAPEAREHLLGQHGRLRQLIGEAEGLAARMLAGQELGPSFRRVVDELRTVLAEHNWAEETLLQPILARGEAWAAEKRTERMFEEHQAEHAALREALAGPDLEVAARMADFAEELTAHMDAEERTFLAPSVLKEG